MSLLLSGAGPERSVPNLLRVFTLTGKGGRTALLLEDPGGAPLDRLIGAPLEAGRFLRHMSAGIPDRSVQTEVSSVSR
jgi:hypothetical protein